MILNLLYNSKCYLRVKIVEVLLADKSIETPHEKSMKINIRIMQLCKIIDELQIIEIKEFSMALIKIFSENITKENYMYFLEETMKFEIYKDLLEAVVTNAKKYLWDIDITTLDPEIQKPLKRYTFVFPIKIELGNRFILKNSNKNQFIYLDNTMTNDIIDSITYFLFKYKIWEPSDIISNESYHYCFAYDRGCSDISFVIAFYSNCSLFKVPTL